MPRRSLDHISVVAAALTLLLLCVHFLSRSSTIPPDFQFKSHFSRQQAEFFYAEARHELEKNFWHAIYGNLKARQFKFAWNRLRNGQGHLAGVVTDASSNVVAFVKFRNGDGYWMTIQFSWGRGLAKGP